MKVKVTSPFNDKATKKYRNIGEEFEVSKERYEEIRKAGRFVTAVPEEKSGAKKPKADAKAKENIDIV